MLHHDVIVVGVDGSAGGRQALHWAVEEALRTDASIRAVTAWTWDAVDAQPFAAASPAQERGRAEAVSVREVDAVCRDFEVTPWITREVVRGEASAVLVNAGRSARMLVVGSHGLSRPLDAVLGAVSAACVRRASTAVVVVPVRHPAPAVPGQDSVGVTG